MARYRNLEPQAVEESLPADSQEEQVDVQVGTVETSFSPVFIQRGAIPFGVYRK